MADIATATSRYYLPYLKATPIITLNLMTRDDTIVQRIATKKCISLILIRAIISIRRYGMLSSPASLGLNATDRRADTAIFS
jgi:hypothetical protein